MCDGDDKESADNDDDDSDDEDNDRWWGKCPKDAPDDGDGDDFCPMILDDLLRTPMRYVRDDELPWAANSPTVVTYYRWNNVESLSVLIHVRM